MTNGKHDRRIDEGRGRLVVHGYEQIQNPRLRLASTRVSWPPRYRPDEAYIVTLRRALRRNPTPQVNAAPPRSTAAGGPANMGQAMVGPSELPARTVPPSSGEPATQLSILLASATSTIEEEFKRSERLDAKSRNLIAVVGAFFAVAQAVVIGLINGSLAATEHHARSSFVLWLGVAGAIACAILVVAIVFSVKAWRLRKDPALGPGTIEAYLSAARAGNPAVGVKLVEAYVKIAKGRRQNNELRAKELERAELWCFVATFMTGIELILAFIAAAAQ